MIKRTLAVVALLAFALPAGAQTPAPQTKAPAPAAAPAPTAAAPAAPAKAAKPAIKPKAERTPESLACSAEADKQGLKGKERQSFRRKCIAEAKKAAKPATPATTAPAPAKKN